MGCMAGWICNLQISSIYDAIMSTWAKLSEERFQHVVESIPLEIKVALKAGHSLRKVYLIKRQLNVHALVKLQQIY